MMTCDKSDMNVEETIDIIDLEREHKKKNKTPRRRSLSGNDVPFNKGSRKMKVDSKKNKFPQRQSQHHDGIQLEKIDNSIDSSSSSNGIKTSETCQLSSCSEKSSNYLTDHSKKCHLFSATSKIKHFLEEHLVKIHPRHHPEYHSHNKNSNNNMSIFNYKTSASVESDFADNSSQISAETSSLNEVSKPKLHSNNDMNSILTSNVLNRIRHINIHSPYDTMKSDSIGSIDYNDIVKEETIPSSDSANDFPFPEPNPCKLPQVTFPSSIDFSPNQILSNKHKRLRLPHSISFDPDYRHSDHITKHLNTKTLNKVMSVGPEKDKWEKKISGYLDTSTSTGATLTAINFGLKRVTETNKFLMITKSPTSGPNDFLMEGITHVEATSAIYKSLLLHSTCYDVMPSSGKVIILDSQMQIGHAFDAIENNIVRASPIWSSEKQAFIALLSVEDLVHLLLHLHQEKISEDPYCESESSLEDFSTMTVEKCLSVIPRFRTLQSHLVGVTPETDLHSVNNMFIKLHKSMLLVIDSYLSGNPLFLLSGLRTLTYLFYKAHTVSLESCFSTKIISSKLLINQTFEILKPVQLPESPGPSFIASGTGRIQYLIYTSSPLIDVLRAMAHSYYCCALIIEKEFKNEDILQNEYFVKDVITIPDIINLVKIQRHNDRIITASHILQFRMESIETLTYRDPVVHCDVTNSIHHLINIIVNNKASFVLIHSTLNAHKSTVGVLSAFDILSYIDSLPCDIIQDYNHISSFQINKSEKFKLNHIENLVGNVRSYSENYGAIKHTPTILDDFEEESLDIELA